MFRNAGLRRLPRSVNVQLQAPRRTFLSLRPEMPSARPVENLNVQKLTRRSHDYQRNKRLFLWMGTVAGLASFIYTAYKLQQEIRKPAQLDSSLSSSDPLSGTNAAERKVVIHDEDGAEIVSTGNSTVPTFPRTLSIPSSAAAPADPLAPSPAIDAPGATEYTLVGLGLRTVTFVGIQVYVVGYYIATADVAALQNALTKKINPIATTLVPGERGQLRTMLLDHTIGEQTWDELLAHGIPARSAFRVVPVRDTDFHHLRDGFVRAIQGKAAAVGGGADDEAFGEAMRQFRGIFNRGSVPKRRELLLLRDEKGRLNVEYDDGSGKKSKSDSRKLIGTVEDERVSRALWLNYLGGKKVASEPARLSIVEGIMEFVERPVGTVATQVV